MKRLSGMVFVILFGVIMGSTAFATTAMVEFAVGANTITLLDNGTAVCSNGNCSLWGITNSPSDTAGAVGKISVNNEGNANTFFGWTFQYSSTSGSPGCTPGGQCTTDTNISVTSSGAGTLNTYFADSGFTTESAFTTSLTTSQDSTGTSASSKFYAYTGMNLDLGAPPSGQIGATLSLGSGTGSTTGGAANPVGTASPFNLQDNVSLTATGANQNFTVTSTIDAVPEPASVMLLGTAILFGAAAIRRRKSGKV